MLKLKFNLRHQDIQLVNKGAVVATDSKDYLVAKFNTISDDWETPLTAIFTDDKHKQPYAVIVGADERLAEDECFVPWEVLTDAANVYVSVYCGNLHTTVTAVFKVRKSGYIEGETPPPPSPTVYDIIMQAITDLQVGKQDKLIAGENITIDENDGTISAEGGVTSYVDLDNKPQINGHELVGNKSSDDLGLQGKLTAGENVTIDENGEISATGGVTSYNDLTDKPQINSVELSGNKTLDNLGVQAKIDNSHKLSSDLIDDTNNTNKFVTAQEKATWNEKEDASNKVTSISASSTNTEYPSAKCVYDMIVDKQKKIYFEQPKNDFRSTHDDGTPYDVGDIFFYRDVIYKIHRGFANTGAVYYDRAVIGTRMGAENPPTTTPARYAWEYKAGEEYIQYNTPQAFNVFTPYKRFLCTQSIEALTPSSYGSHLYTWVEIPLGTNLESVANKVTSLSVSSTDTQYPSAKCVYDAISASSGTVITSATVNNNGTITFTDSDGNTFTTTGSSVIGADGFSPVATVTQTASGATVSITDSTGTTTANISNGQDGNDYVLTAQDKSDIADIVLSELPTTQGVLYGN